MRFSKYQGTGNDFILLNGFHQPVSHGAKLARLLCDRHFGIGSDGLIVIEPDAVSDFKMIFYNPDGSQSFCGNGSRCAVRYAESEGIIRNRTTRFLSTDGEHSATLSTERIDLSMHEPEFSSQSYTDAEIQSVHTRILNTGSPHLLIFPDGNTDLDELDIKYHGARIRYQDMFNPAGINVNFVQQNSEKGISLRTYERGVEDETLSCGTGVTAAAIGFHEAFIKTTGNFEVPVMTRGGNLWVKGHFDGAKYSEILLCGPAKKVFEGVIDIP